MTPPSSQNATACGSASSYAEAAAPPTDFRQDRLRRLRRALRRRRVDALLVSRPENRFYLSGFAAEDLDPAERSGHLLLLARGARFLLTDFRYQEQAERQALGWEVMLYRGGPAELLGRLLVRLGCRRLAFESHAVLHYDAERLSASLAKEGIDCVPTTDLVERLRRIKDTEEQACLQRSVALNEQVFQKVVRQLAPGKTERQVAWEIETELRRLGAQRASFPPIVASGPNAALPHAEPSDRVLREGEPIIIDMGLVLDGYCSDMTRTVTLGPPEPLFLDRLRLVRRAQKEAIAAARAGMTGRELDQVARRVLAAAGYGAAFGHGLGHGVGLAVHEQPSVNPRARRKLPAGAVITIEPGIYLPGWGGIRLEQMVVIEENGCLLLNQDTTFLDI